MGFLGKLFKGPEPDMEKSAANAKKMRQLFNHVVEDGDDYRLIFGYTEDVSRFNYGFVHGSKTKIGNLIVGWNEDSQTIAVVPTVPDLSGCSDPSFYRRTEIDVYKRQFSYCSSFIFLLYLKSQIIQFVKLFFFNMYRFENMPPLFIQHF